MGQHNSQYYIDRAKHPLFPGCNITVRELCFVLMDEKKTFKGKDKHFDRMCRWVTSLFAKGLGRIYVTCKQWGKDVCSGFDGQQLFVQF